MERTDAEGAGRGHEGPVPIHCYDSSSTTPTLRAFAQTFVEAGYEEIPDINGGMRQGISLGSRNVVGHVRVNAGLAYLTPEVRDRPNLTIRQATQVGRIEFDGPSAVGIRLTDGKLIAGREVVLCSGAYGSPAVLMRSGIGPASDLESLGIPVVADLPVGQGLRDHPAFFSTYALKKGVADVEPACGPVLATSSAGSGGIDLDLWVFANNLKAPFWQKSDAMLVIGAAVMRPESRGTVRLKSRDPSDSPIIDFNLLSTPADRRRILEAVRLGRWAAGTGPLADFIDHEVGPGAAVTDDASLMAAIESGVGTFDHGCCTARMGAANDPLAVTDRVGRVRGIEGLRVVDASIFADTVSVPINLTTMMLAERIAAEMLVEGASSRTLRPRSGVGL
jgi:choline dehydrogenase